ncbi:MAG TPA: ParA family protein [Acidobacteriaceae bacterium]|nr:ParA family protein [Acidobacteriaceae bacterium]
MIVTVASYKGGVCKTTTAVHLAAFLDSLAPDQTALLDGDPTKNATAWSLRGKGFPFPVAPVEAAAKYARQFPHLVLDTGQRPSVEDLKGNANYSDLLVIPAVPSSLDTDGLVQTIMALKQIEGAKFRVLLTRVAADAARQALDLRELLATHDVPVFRAEIPRLKAFEKAAGAGTIVSAVDDRNAERAWAAYAAAGQELLG